ncbi:MAG: hypothetical protein HKN09_07980 [Saprospiraceae bacterium]|nr:hypothetical protein [Saprospiraceae bacterium]
MRKLQIILLLSLTSICLQADGAGDHITQLKARCVEANSIQEEVEAMLDLAKYYREILYENTRADSVYDEVFGKLTTSIDYKLKFHAYKHFLDYIPIKYETPECRIACEQIIEVIDDNEREGIYFEAHLAVGKASLKLGDIDQALKHAIKASDWSQSQGNASQKIKSKFLLGEIKTVEGEIEEAFRYFMEARVLMEILTEEEISRYVYDHHGLLFQLYQSIKNYNSAQKHKVEQIKWAEAQNPVDSTVLMFHKLDLAGLFVVSKNPTSLDPLFDEITAYAKQTHNIKLKGYSLSLYRTWLIDSSQLIDLKNLMKEHYPEEIKSNWQNSILAHVYEGEGKMDSSEYYFRLDEASVLSTKNNFLKAHFYHRFGHHFLRRSKLDQAKVQFQNSAKYAKQTKGGEDLYIDAMQQLEMIALSKNDYKQAYKFAQVSDSILMEQFDIQHRNNISEMRVKSEEERERVIAERKVEEKKKKFQRQYFFIVILVLLGLLVLVVISSMSVPEWLIEMIAFFSILSVFEFVVLLMDAPIKAYTDGEPLKNFAIKMIIFSILFPLHHLIESSVTTYLKKNKLLASHKSFSFKRLLGTIWPWLKDKTEKGLKS